MSESLRVIIENVSTGGRRDVSADWFHDRGQPIRDGLLFDGHKVIGSYNEAFAQHRAWAEREFQRGEK